MTSRWLKLVLVAVVVLIGVGLSFSYLTGYRIPVQADLALEQSQEFKLLSLNPDLELSLTVQETNAPRLFGYLVLGETEITSLEIRKQLTSALRKAVSNGTSVAPRCFNPRHAIRVMHKGKQFHFLLCFECWRMRIISTGETNYVSMRGDQTSFDEVLIQAHVPLPPSPKH